MIKMRLQALRQIMKREGIDYYLIPSQDYHNSEYVGEYFKTRQFITGFTGSAGTALIWANGAGLWTDGRYFLQARQQLEGSSIVLFPSGESGVPTIQEFLKEHLQPGQCMAADGRTISAEFGEALETMAQNGGGSFQDSADLAGEIWVDRPKRSTQPVWLLSRQYAGEETGEKLQKVRKRMEEEQADVLVLSSLDEIAWLFNIRGSDVSYCPLILAYAVITRKKTYLYLQTEAVTEELKEMAARLQIQIEPYEKIYHDIPDILALEVKKGKAWADPSQMNYRLWKQICEAAAVTAKPSPVRLFKAVKNETEQSNIERAHRLDGAAVSRFLCWLSCQVGKMEITEQTAARKLEAFRKEYGSYLMPSFAPIVAYQEHGAIVHYSADEKSDCPLRPEGLLLFDTGGHYREGSTDITRTVALGPVSDRQREHYTRVLIGNLRLAALQFPQGCSGENLDLAARAALWEAGLDYNHGTGHGVGYLLNIHEGPQVIRWKQPKDQKTVPFKPGMIISDEPGLYLEGEYGIRLENLLVCESRVQNSFGQFLGFRTLTLAPFDLNCIKPELMSQKDKELLDHYHWRVRETLMDLMQTDTERQWLAENTVPLDKWVLRRYGKSEI